MNRTTSLAAAAALLAGAAQAQILAPARTLANLPGSYKPIVQDLDHDGAPDLAIGAESGTTRVHVLLGDGLGGFAAPTTPSAGFGQTLSVAVADLNGDRNPDLVATGAGSPSYVVVFLGDGLGGFGTGSAFSTGGSSAVDVAVGDLNGDGRPDAVVANKSGLTIHLGDGLGGFLAPTAVVVGSAPNGVVLADLDRDGRLDAATANAGSNDVSVLLGDGAGGFLPRTDYPTAVGSLRIAAADLDGNGLIDLVTANNGSVSVISSTVSILFGTGGGAFAPAMTIPSGGGAPNERARAVAVGDINLDGLPDLAVANGDGQTVSVLLGQGAQSFVLERAYPVGGGAEGVTIADLNGDGRPDVVTANSRANNSSVLLGRFPSPIGLADYGTGTPGCAGTMTMWSGALPKVGNAGFLVTCSNTPPNATGFLLVGLPKNVAGYDPGLGFLLHLGPAVVIVVPLPSAGGASGAASLPVPQNPVLAGALLFTQALYFTPRAQGDTCSRSGIATSKGLAVTIQP